MTLETSLATMVASYDAKIAYDNACKNVLSMKEILARIVKKCIWEYHDYDVFTIMNEFMTDKITIGQTPVHRDEAGKVRLADTEDKTLYEGTIRYDIRFYIRVPNTEENAEMIINVEAQNQYANGYPLMCRSTYYGCRLVSSQKETEFFKSDYQKIKKVYSIWICTDVPAHMQNSINTYEITERQLVGNVRNDPREYQLMNVVMVYLGKKDSTNDELLRMLEVLLSSERNVEEKKYILENEFDIMMSKKMEGGIREMCNLSDGIEQKGIEIGEKRGKKQGKAEGIRIGKKRGKETALLASIKNLSTKLNLSIEQAMDVLEIPEADRAFYSQKIFS